LRLRVDDLLAVLAISREGSVNRAAAALNMTQPTLSRMLRNFEHELGAPLFVRTPKGVTPTRVGAMVLDHARSVDGQVQSTQREINSYVAGEAPSVILGVVPVHPIELVVQAINLVAEQCPTSVIKVVSGTTEMLMAALQSGDIDILLDRLPINRPGPGIVEEVLYTEKLFVYAGAAHPLAGLKASQIAAIADAGWALGPIGSSSRTLVEDLFRALDLPPPKVPVEIDNVPGQRALIKKGTFLTVLLRHQVLSELKSKEIVELPIDLPQHFRKIGVLRLARRSGLTDIYETTLSCLRQVLNEEVLERIA
jgi:DNA-binding transcriptional LysR family regulator